jgi:DNA-binding transcriptional ArsR family regulator
MRAATVDLVFRALADPTRRRVLDLLRDRVRSVSELQADFKISQPALSRHLKVLRDAKLVMFRRAGRLNVYQLNAEPMGAVNDWMRHYEEFWLQSFKNLDGILAADAARKER